MMPLHAGGSRLWQAVRGVGNWSLILAVVTTLAVGGALTRSTLVGAQALGQGQGLGQDPSFFPATGYRISSPAILSYFQHHGGVRAIGFPVSNDFPLLGRRVQIFQRQVLELRTDGTVGTVNVLDPDVLPITHMDGLSLPPVDPDLIGAAPPQTSADYLNQALSYVSVYVPDEWNGLQVNFQTTFLETVKCADAFGDEPCDPSQLAAMALDLWGLPTSQPTLDPMNNEFVYQRFERGIMHFSRATSLTQGLLVGDWFKRILVGINLSQDLGPEVLGSRFYAQFVPARPLGLARPNDLPDTSLAQAFRADTLMVAGQAQQEATLPPTAAAAATMAAETATAITATQIALQSTQVAQSSTSVALTATAQVAGSTPTVQPAGTVSDVPVSAEGCLGDEQMWFIPRRPNVGTHVEIAVTSRRRHDVRFVRLAGPLDPGIPQERLSALGFVWTWTVVPAVESFHQWTFYADGLRPCIVSGFNTFAPLGASPTPTETPIPTETPGTATATATSTPVPIPTLNSVSPPSSAASRLTCGQIVSLQGNNFGSPPSNVGTFAQLSNGTALFTLQLIGTGSNTQMRVQMPPNMVLSDTSTVTVSNSGGDSAPVTVFTALCP